MTKDPNIELIQKGLVGLGYDVGRAGIDGRNGPDTRAAAASFAQGVKIEPVDPPSPNIAVDPGRHLNGVKTVLAEIVLEAAKSTEAPFVVNEGLRSAARQAQLVKSGASKTMNSKHLTGDAVDLWPVDPVTMKKLPSDAAFSKGSAEARAADAALWKALRLIAKAMKAEAVKRGVRLTWGGDWKSFPDGPHFELG